MQLILGQNHIIKLCLFICITTLEENAFYYHGINVQSSVKCRYTSVGQANCTYQCEYQNLNVHIITENLW